MKLNRLVKISIMAGILSVLSIISIPVGIVPITLQTLGVFLCGFILGAVDGTLSVVVYLILGAAGIPVFAGGTEGIGVLFGPTGGFLFAFLPVAYISGYFSEKSSSRIYLYFTGILCTIIIYIVGVPYLALMAHISLGKAAAAGAYPFIIPDLVKMLIAATLGFEIRKRLVRLGLLSHTES